MSTITDNLYADILGHYEKRNRDSISHYDPANLDRGQLEEYFAKFAPKAVSERIDRLDDALFMLSDPGEDREAIDEFAASAIENTAEVKAIFEDQFFFGCEADDPMNAVGFNRAVNPMGAQLRAIFSSDIGHWDVTDMSETVEEAWELVDEGLLSEADFRDFTFVNAASMWKEADPGFFEGTVVADAVKAL